MVVVEVVVELLELLLELVELVELVAARTKEICAAAAEIAAMHRRAAHVRMRATGASRRQREEFGVCESCVWMQKL